MRLGVDIGGTKTEAVAVDGTGGIIQRLRLVTGFGHDAVAQTAISAINGIAELCDISPSEFTSIGIGIPGVVDGQSGRVSHAVNLGLDDFDLASAISESLGISVRIDNDVTAAAYGTYQFLRPGASMGYLNLGTGLAAGLVIDGKPWRGARGGAGEIGHIPVDPSGLHCGCGQRGCLETVASGSGIARAWATDDPYPARSLFDAADAGDAAAIVIRDSFVNGVASAVRILILTADVETIVIGGGLSHLGDDLLSAVRGVLAEWAAASPFLASLDLESRVLLMPQAFPAAAVGAALLGGQIRETV